MYTDTIADYLTRIRNAQKAGHKVVDIPSSKLKKSITFSKLLNYQLSSTGNFDFSNNNKNDLVVYIGNFVW